MRCLGKGRSFEAPPILQLGDLEPQRQEESEEAAAAHLDELDHQTQGEQEAVVASELGDLEPQRQEDQEEATGIAEEKDAEGVGGISRMSKMQSRVEANC
jgi:hypothetical protein